MADTVLNNFSPLTNIAERIGDFSTPVPEKTFPERAASYIDARDTKATIQDERKTPGWQRVLSYAVPGAIAGALGIGLKGGMAFGNRDALIHGMQFGAVSGAGMATATSLYDQLSEKRRLRRAKRIVNQTNDYTKERVSQPVLSEPASDYQRSRAYPLRYGEVGMLAGGIAGTTAGRLLAPHVDPSQDRQVELPFGFHASANALSSMGRYGLGGTALGIGAGVLAGHFVKEHRRKKLIEALSKHAEDYVKTSGLSPEQMAEEEKRRKRVEQVVVSMMTLPKLAVTQTLSNVPNNAPRGLVHTGGRTAKASNRSMMRNAMVEQYAAGQFLKWSADNKMRPRSEVVIYNKTGIVGLKKEDHILFPGGGIDDGETPEFACYREAIEEADRKLLHMKPMGYTESVWPKDQVLVEGFEGSRTYHFMALDGGTIGTNHPDKEAFTVIPFEEALKFLEELLSRPGQEWAKEDNENRIQSIEEAQKMVEAGFTEPAKLASVKTSAATLSVMTDDEPDRHDNHPAVLVDLDHTIRDWPRETRGLGEQFVMPNRKETLKPLKDLGFKVIGVTNQTTNENISPEHLAALQHETLGHMDGIIDDVCYTPSADPTILKPSPHMIDHVIRRHGLDRNRTVMVGNHDDHDGGAAKNAGIPYVDEKQFFADPEATIESIKHLSGQPKVADTVATLPRNEYIVMNDQGQVLVKPTGERRYEFPTKGMGTRAPYEPAIRHMPPGGAAEPGIHGYDYQLHNGTQGELEGGQWVDADEVRKNLYASMGLKANAPYRDIDRARSRVIFRQHKKLKASQPAIAPTVPTEPLTPPTPMAQFFAPTGVTSENT